MAVSVPFATSVLPQPIDQQIARGPDLSWIGNLPNAYWLCGASRC
jgi:hypothetical protein